MLNDGTIIRGLRVRFEAGHAVEVDADENGAALRAHLRIDEGATGSASSPSSTAWAGSARSRTVFYDTLIDENAASHIALGSAYPFVLEDEEDRARANVSATHVDFMIGSPELEVTGITGRRRAGAGAAARRLAGLARFGPETEYHRAA